MNKEILIKKLLYRSNYRGCKETDFLIGNFAKAKINQFKDLALYENFLAEKDGEIYDWIMDKYQAPKQYQELVRQIQDFHKI